MSNDKEIQEIQAELDYCMRQLENYTKLHSMWQGGWIYANMKSTFTARVEALTQQLEEATRKSQQFTAEMVKAILKERHEQSQYINWDLDITVCMSGGGYYIGMVDEDGQPEARFSVDYYRTREQAQEALDNGTFRMKLWL